MTARHSSEPPEVRDRLGKLWDEGLASGRASRQLSIEDIKHEARRRLDDAFDELWSSQSGRCAICGEAMPKTRFDVAHATIWKKRRPTVDHIRPRKKGGRDDRANLQLAHAECNWRKGSAWTPSRI